MERRNGGVADTGISTGTVSNHRADNGVERTMEVSPPAWHTRSRTIPRRIPRRRRRTEFADSWRSWRFYAPTFWRGTNKEDGRWMGWRQKTPGNAK